MKIISIDLTDKTFETEDGEIFPLVFNVNENITLDKFQELVDKGEWSVKNML